mgnify:CR=1 FL=1
MIKGEKMMFLIKRKKHIVFGLIVIFFLVSLFLAYSLIKEDNEIDPQTLEKRILSLGELTTVEYYYKDILHYQDARELKGIELPFSAKSLLILYEGYIKAGVDLTNISIEVKEEKNITLKLKNAHFTDNVIKEESIKVYDEKSGLFNPLKLEEVFHLLEEKKKKTQQELKKEGFLKEANQRTEKLLTSLLKEMGFERITIQFQS